MRPRKYKTLDELEKNINEYFDWCDAHEFKPYTVSGLCLYLDVCRDTLLEYEKNISEFSDTIKRAKKRIENWIEENAMTRKIDNTFSIFNLKNNFGWKDKQEIESTNTNKNENINVEINNMSEDELKEIARQLLKD